MVWMKAVVMAATLFTGIGTAKADFVVDLFNEPPTPTHTSSPGGTVYAGPFAPPQVIATRVLTGRAPLTNGLSDAGALVVGGGLLLGTLAPGESAMYTALFSPQNFSGGLVDLMNFVNFTLPSFSTTIDAYVNGTLVGSAVWTGGQAPDIALGAVGAGTSLDLVFTASAGNSDQFVFVGDGIQVQGVEAVPEPATMTLLGLGMGGVAVNSWRRRKQKAASTTSTTAC